MDQTEIEEQRRTAASAALAEVRAGMRLGLGTGRTAAHFVRLLGAEVRRGLSVEAVPTSERTAELARAEGIPLVSLDRDIDALDLAVDGADEIDPRLALVKGGGGALLREKIVASAAERVIIIADLTKSVAVLGAFPLPIEVAPFGLAATRRAIGRAAEELGLRGKIALRGGDAPFVTDGGNFIVDGSFGAIPDPEGLARALDAIPGVMCHGLFLGVASLALVGGERLTPPER